MSAQLDLLKSRKKKKAEFLENAGNKNDSVLTDVFSSKNILFLLCCKTVLQLLSPVLGLILSFIFLLDYRGYKRPTFLWILALQPAEPQPVIEAGHQANNECYN